MVWQEKIFCYLQQCLVSLRQKSLFAKKATGTLKTVFLLSPEEKMPSAL